MTRATGHDPNGDIPADVATTKLLPVDLPKTSRQSRQADATTLRGWRHRRQDLHRFVPKGVVMPRATLQLHLVEPGLAELVLADPDLSLPAKLTLLYVLSRVRLVQRDLLSWEVAVWLCES
jgi:hypothetical protein